MYPANSFQTYESISIVNLSFGANINIPIYNVLTRPPIRMAILAPVKTMIAGVIQFAIAATK